MAEQILDAGSAVVLTKRERIARAELVVRRAERAVDRAVGAYRAAETRQLARQVSLPATSRRVTDAKARTIALARDLAAARDHLVTARETLAAARAPVGRS